MALNRKIAVIGSAIAASIDDKTKSHEELLYDLTQAVLKDAGLVIEDIDGIVVGSNDQFDGRAISVMAASGSVGGVDRDILSTPSAGEHAFVMGALRVASGLYETQLVVSWSPTEATSLSEAQRLGADPYFHRKLPMDEVTTAALQANAMASRDGSIHAHAETIAERSRARAGIAYPGGGADAGGEHPWPLKRGMISAPVNGMVAMVIASEECVAEKGIKNPAWIRGMGWATDAGFLGDRDLATSPALQEAARQAYFEAGIDGAKGAVDVVELTGATPYQELMVYDGLGISAPSSWGEDIASGRFEAAGSLPVNPSGGVIPINPVFCTGLIRIAEAANQVRGTAGNHQVKDAKSALAHAASGFAMMYQTVVVFDANREGASK
jgi:acetyl-CoA C-acetyltransferase